MRGHPGRLGGHLCLAIWSPAWAGNQQSVVAMLVLKGQMGAMGAARGQLQGQHHHPSLSVSVLVFMVQAAGPERDSLAEEDPHL